MARAAAKLVMLEEDSFTSPDSYLVNGKCFLSSLYQLFKWLEVLIISKLGCDEM